MCRATAFASILALTVATAIQAAAPQLINYQGRLTDATGDPVVDGSYSVVFAIYDAAAAGNSVWTETQNVNTADGFFAVLLGSVNPILDTVFNSAVRYLEVDVDGDILSPRTRLASVGYSHRVSTVDGAAGGTISGDVNIQSELVVNGPLIRTVARASGLGPNDGLDAGMIISRTLVFTKTQDATAVRVSYTDNFRSIGIGSCRWEIRFNGVSCPSGVLVYDYYTGEVGDNDHGSYTVVGHCEGLGQGTYNIQIFVGSTPGFAGVDCFTGYNNSRWVLEAEEVY